MDQLKRLRRHAGRREQIDGFTLIEVMIAMGILAIGLLAVAAMQVHAMRGGRDGRHLTQATAVARTQLEQFQRMDFDAPALTATAGWAPLPAQQITRTVQANPANQVEATYNLQWRVTDLNAPTTLKDIDVQVTWSEANRPNRVVSLSTRRFEK